MDKLAPVSSKSQVVIPAKIRKKLGEPKTVLIREANGKIIMEPALSFEEAFGTGGKIMHKVAVGISKDRRREVRLEKLRNRAEQ